ncbi:MAG TPA: His/Gly/Thr/Pro-type tRNA ligase C-terminal domain-containing protein [Bellilinea sp.]
MRDAQNLKIPYMLIIGDKEAAAGQIALRSRSGEDSGVLPLADFMTRVKKDIEELV